MPPRTSEQCPELMKLARSMCNIESRSEMKDLCSQIVNNATDGCKVPRSVFQVIVGNIAAKGHIDILTEFLATNLPYRAAAVFALAAARQGLDCGKAVIDSLSAFIDDDIDDLATTNDLLRAAIICVTKSPSLAPALAPLSLRLLSSVRRMADPALAARLAQLCIGDTIFNVIFTELPLHAAWRAAAELAASPVPPTPAPAGAAALATLALRLDPDRHTVVQPDRIAAMHAATVVAAGRDAWPAAAAVAALEQGIWTAALLAPATVPTPKMPTVSQAALAVFQGVPEPSRLPPHLLVELIVELGRRRAGRVGDEERMGESVKQLLKPTPENILALTTQNQLDRVTSAITSVKNRADREKLPTLQLDILNAVKQLIDSLQDLPLDEDAVRPLRSGLLATVGAVGAGAGAAELAAEQLRAGVAGSAQLARLVGDELFKHYNVIDECLAGNTTSLQLLPGNIIVNENDGVWAYERFIGISRSIVSPSSSISSSIVTLLPCLFSAAVACPATAARLATAPELPALVWLAVGYTAFALQGGAASSSLAADTVNTLELDQIAATPAPTQALAIAAPATCACPLDIWSSAANDLSFTFRPSPCPAPVLVPALTRTLTSLSHLAPHLPPATRETIADATLAGALTARSSVVGTSLANVARALTSEPMVRGVAVLRGLGRGRGSATRRSVALQAVAAAFGLSDMEDSSEGSDWPLLTVSEDVLLSGANPVRWMQLDDASARARTQPDDFASNKSPERIASLHRMNLIEVVIRHPQFTRPLGTLYAQLTATLAATSDWATKSAANHALIAVAAKLVAEPHAASAADGAATGMGAIGSGRPTAPARHRPRLPPVQLLPAEVVGAPRTDSVSFMLFLTLLSRCGPGSDRLVRDALLTSAPAPAPAHTSAVARAVAALTSGDEMQPGTPFYTTLEAQLATPATQPLALAVVASCAMIDPRAGGLAGLLEAKPRQVAAAQWVVASVYVHLQRGDPEAAAQAVNSALSSLPPAPPLAAAVVAASARMLTLLPLTSGRGLFLPSHESLFVCEALFSHCQATLKPALSAAHGVIYDLEHAGRLPPEHADKWNLEQRQLMLCGSLPPAPLPGLPPSLETAVLNSRLEVA